MNTSRRSLFSLFVGGATIAAVGQVKADFQLIEVGTDPSHTHELLPNIRSLPTIRDMLYPGLWTVTKEGPDYEADILVDYKRDALLVKVYRFSTKKDLGFAITRKCINENRYKAEFHPNLLEVLKRLKNES